MWEVITFISNPMSIYKSPKSCDFTSIIKVGDIFNYCFSVDGAHC